MRIGIVGLGAVGAAVAARLLSSGRTAGEVGLSAGSEASVAALRERGLRVGESPAALRPGFAASRPAFVRGEDLTGLSAALPRRLSPYQLLLLCTRAEETRSALESALPLLDPAGAVVCLQNGLPEEAAAALAGPQRTFGAVINWSATAIRPGQVEVTGRGDFVLGAASPGEESSAALPGIAWILGAAFPVRVTSNLPGFRWSKLSLNCAISTLGAVSGLTFGELAAHRLGRALCARVVGEVVAVARACGISLERVSGLDPAWLADSGGGDARARLLRPLRRALLLLASRARPRQQSGMLARLRQGRTSGQVDDLNGAVVAAARRRGLAAPLDERLVELVHGIERREEQIGPHQLGRLWDWARERALA